MGGVLSALQRLLGYKRNMRILMIGLDDAGKTTLLYKMKLNEYVRTVPTLGFNVEFIRYKNISLTMWDVGGQQQFRSLWKHYYTGVESFIFVIDSGNLTRIHECREVIQELLGSLSKKSHVLIFANKQDLPQALTSDQLIDILKLNLYPEIIWKVQESCAQTGQGICDGLDWLTEIFFNGEKQQYNSSIKLDVFNSLYEKENKSLKLSDSYNKSTDVSILLTIP